MIKIIKGVYGYWNGVCVVPKTKLDEPFEVSSEQEERLIKLGVAVHVDVEPETVDIESGFEVTEEYLNELSLNALKEFASQFGIKFKVGTKKADFVAKILATLETQASAETESETVDDGEEPPIFDAMEAVQ